MALRLVAPEALQDSTLQRSLVHQFDLPELKNSPYPASSPSEDMREAPRAPQSLLQVSERSAFYSASLEIPPEPNPQAALLLRSRAPAYSGRDLNSLSTQSTATVVAVDQQGSVYFTIQDHAIEQSLGHRAWVGSPPVEVKIVNYLGDNPRDDLLLVKAEFSSDWPHFMFELEPVKILEPQSVEAMAQAGVHLPVVTAGYLQNPHAPDLAQRADALTQLFRVAEFQEPLLFDQGSYTGLREASTETGNKLSFMRIDQSIVDHGVSGSGVSLLLADGKMYSFGTIAAKGTSHENMRASYVSPWPPELLNYLQNNLGVQVYALSAPRLPFS